MLSFRYIVRLTQAFFNKFKAIIMISVIIGILFFLILTFLFPSLTSDTKKIGIVGRYTPDSLPLEITSLISEGLTKVDENGNIVPAIAKSWETTDGGKTWIFVLNTNLYWQDGKNVTTNDISYQFSDAKYEKVDKYTLRFNLNNQFSAFPIIVSNPIFKKGLLGTGKYKVKSISLVGGYVQNLTITNQKKDKIIYKFYPSEDRLILAFKLGQIDIINKIQGIDQFKKWKVVNTSKYTSYNNFVGIFFNTEDEKLSEKTLRQNLNYAIDKNIFNEVRAIGPISPNSWAYNSQVKQYSKDLTKTKDLKDLTIKLSTLPNLLDVAEKIKQEWEAVGVKTEIEIVSNIPNNYQAFLATIDIPKDPDQYSLWHSTQDETNISRLKNPRIDKLLEDGRTELDQILRKKIYLDFQRFLVEDVPAIFLYHPSYYTISRK